MTGKIKRIPSGIPGLDEMIEGGFLFPSTILIAGGTGTGKTTLSTQILFESAKQGNDCIYFTTFSEWALKFLSDFDFIDERYTAKMKFVELGVYVRDEPSVEGVLEVIESNIKEIMPQRIIIDPISSVGDIMTETDYRTFLYDLSKMTRNLEVLTILTGETMPGSPYPVTLAFISDGVILLSNDFEGEKRRRRIEVMKMRGTNHYTWKCPFEISRNGLTVYPSK